ncbi:MAG TPA: aminotransferase class III-fold pyridoxal phosphate-dependent enzyme [Kofleriaceae bacterium]|nr:aminotransferase class III-fold pyridoxal phosphate-dependent enzyme [Kofleriaceae bacterium]
MSVIHIVTEIPGPKSRAILARRDAAVMRGLGRSTEVVIERAEGALLHDVDGNTLLDFAGGIGMISTGHCHAGAVAAIEAQAARLVHACALVATYEPYVALCELLNEVTPGSFAKKTLLATSGAEAVENAIKVARAYTGRPAVLCFEGAYHGRTLLTLSLTSKTAPYKRGLGPFAPEIYRVQPTVAALERALVAQVDPEDLAAIIIEPVQGEGGFIPIPAPVMRRIRELCTQHGVVMIADEVQTGFGRTGTLFAVEHTGVVPDVVCMAKAMGGGMPISATTGRAEMMDAAGPGGVGGTYGGSPVACAAAIASVQAIRQPAFLAHARRLGEVMRAELDGWAADLPLVGEVRGVGPMLLVELLSDREAFTPATAEAAAVVKRAAAGGVVMIRAGMYGNGIRFMPPLVIGEEELREGLAVVREAIRESRVR